MSLLIETCPVNRDILSRLTPGEEEVWLVWLGQAGFLIAQGRHRILIDPYLSDFLADKYRGTYYPHLRMMPPPIQVEYLPSIDWVLCSHRHGDHMDPGSLPRLASLQPNCRFIVPEAELESARAIGLPEDQLMGIDAGQQFELSNGLCLDAIPSAHEKLKRDTWGRYHFLGFILKIGGITLYHSGDCVPYPDLVRRLIGWPIDMALLPVNGRDEERQSRGVPGNMTLDEAVTLCREAGIDHLLVHHFGMFAFNTADPEALYQRAEEVSPQGPVCHVPRIGIALVLRQAGGPGKTGRPPRSGRPGE